MTKKKIKKEDWVEVKEPSLKKGDKIWVKGKEGLKFHKDLKKNREFLTKVFNPRPLYTSEFDIFSIWWGKQKTHVTSELNLLSQGDLRFDFDKKGNVIGLEIDNFSKVLKKFDCDNKQNKKELNKRFKKK